MSLRKLLVKRVVGEIRKLKLALCWKRRHVYIEVNSVLDFMATSCSIG
jgi:hypothetical protein